MFYEITATVRFYLSYDCFSFSALTVELVSVVNMALSGTASRRYAPITKSYVTCGRNNLYGMALLNNSDII